MSAVHFKPEIRHEIGDRPERVGSFESLEPAIQLQFLRII
jgi:hypothetical protein